MDDTVSAFRKKMEIFQELVKPMLKSLDNDQRLLVVSIKSIRVNQLLCIEN